VAALAYYQGATPAPETASVKGRTLRKRAEKKEKETYSSDLVGHAWGEKFGGSVLKGPSCTAIKGGGGSFGKKRFQYLLREMLRERETAEPNGMGKKRTFAAKNPAKVGGPTAMVIS